MTNDRAHHAADGSVPLWDDAIGDVLRRHARERGADPAVAAWVDDGEDGSGARLESLTYAQLHAAAARTAAELLRHTHAGSRIAVWSPNRPGWIVVEYAAALAGLVLVPINPALTDAEVHDLLDRSRAVALLAATGFRGSPLLERARALAARLPLLRRVVDVDSVLVGDGPVPSLPPVDPAAPFLVQFTSGTTGAPKGAVLTQRAALNVGVMAAAALELGDGPVWCNPMPMHHVGGSVCVLLAVLPTAGTVVLLPGFEPGLVLDLAERTRATILGAVPTMLMALLDHPSRPARDLSALRVVQIGGSAVGTALIRRVEEAFGAAVVNAYGQSEVPSAAQTRLGDSDEVKATTIGRPGLHREARIARIGTGETARCGEPGELQIRSPLMMTGYLDDPARTAEVLGADGWLRTGDRCSMDPDGVLSFQGRLRDVVIRGGENVYPAEVEDVLVRHPAVADAAVVGMPDERWGEQVAAFVRFRPGASAGWPELERHARDALAGFKVPRVWREVDGFPLTASGKVQKFRLKEALQQEALQQEALQQEALQQETGA